MAKVQKAAQTGAIAKLREWINPGDTVYTILDHVSASGMTRHIRCVLLKADGSRVTDLHPNRVIATALGYRQAKRDGLVVSGCGMDMGFEIVYNLGRTLWPEGYGCTGDDCRSNDHSNGDHNHEPHHAEGTREVGWAERRTGETGQAIGTWGETNSWGKRTFTAEDGAVYYLFPDEVVSDEPAAQHWHSNSGYALTHRWL